MLANGLCDLHRLLLREADVLLGLRLDLLGIVIQSWILQLVLDTALEVLLDELGSRLRDLLSIGLEVSHKLSGWTLLV